MPTSEVIKTPTLLWIDVVSPEKSELQSLAEAHGLDPFQVSNCLDPEKLPKWETNESSAFLLLRAYDESCLDEGDTVQSITRKIAVFHRENLILTVHSREQPYLVELRSHWKSKDQNLIRANDILLHHMNKAIASYGDPIDRAYTKFESLEGSVFESKSASPFNITEAYQVKRRATIIKRMLRLTIDVLSDFPVQKENKNMKRIREEARSLLEYSEDLLDGISGLLNLHISLLSQKTNEASHRVNEVMRVLTILSVFILPLNLVTGIYGMNFDHMPELHWRWGYPFALGAMVSVLGVTYIFFKRNGWLK